MSGIETILQQPWVTRAGWTLVHFLWQGSAIAILLAVVRELAGPRLTARGRYGLSCAALAAMTAAPLATFLAAGNLAAAALPRPAWPVAGGPTWERLLPWFVVLWLSGVVVFSARIAAGWRKASRLRQAAAGPVPREWQQALDELIRRMRVSAPVRLLASALAPAPAVVGWLRPAILMPIEAMAGLPIEQVRALLAHELAHVLRQDYLVNILQSIAEAALFYHPAVWWVSGQIRTERELCCDDLAVEASGDVLTYATALAELDGRRRVRLQAVMAADGGSLVHRIRRLAGRSEPVSHSLPGPASVWAVTILWLAGIGAVALHAGQTPPAHLALRAFVPRGIAAAPLVALPAPPPIQVSSASPMLAALLFDPFFAAPLPQTDPSDADKQLASVSGLVTTTSGTPVAGAQVILIQTSPMPATAAARAPQRRTVMSGPDGKFALDKVTPGEYRLMVSHPAYLSSSGSALTGSMPGIAVTLTAGQRMSEVSLKLTEPATVSGRVVDEDGDPMGFVDVLVMRPGYYVGRRTRFSVATVISKDDGTFKVERVPAGQYYLRVSARGLHTIPERAPVPALKPGQKDLRPDSTYYGGGHEPEGATIIDIGAGQNISMGDVKMLDELFLHVRGKVVGDPALLQGARVVRMNREPTSGYGWSFGADVQKDGSFDLPNMWSSTFCLTVMTARQEILGWTPIVISKEDLEGVRIAANAAPLSGRITVEGADTAKPADPNTPVRYRVQLTAVDIPATIQAGAMTKPDGSFATSALAPGKYIADITGLPAGSYLKSLRMSGVDVLNDDLYWSADPGRTLEAVISPKAATLDGIVRDEDGNPVTGTVTLVPVPAPRSRAAVPQRHRRSAGQVQLFERRAGRV
jgi:beta-lactamase regulating signal transducer with metallopeptidase domain